ncbi:uncharacterized protein LOC118485095 [Helianthus annuus]|uniref:uncharacterized protein LOC118485095 n=1 Tax=Helianthus annuus TaxID=4232 RepID=UPI00165317F6|nr:uncharacterized protein LOC118485095 [Helianthus annuus]
MSVVYCSCGREATIMISRTNRNPGRRFYGCPQKGCRGFIQWVTDGPLDTMPALLRALNFLESSNEQLLTSNRLLEEKLKETKAENMKLRMYLIVIVVVVIVWLGVRVMVIAVLVV